MLSSRAKSRDPDECLDVRRDPSTSLGMTGDSKRTSDSRQAFSRCGMNIVKHLHAPPALRNSLIGSGWQV